MVTESSINISLRWKSDTNLKQNFESPITCTLKVQTSRNFQYRQIWTWRFYGVHFCQTWRWKTIWSCMGPGQTAFSALRTEDLPHTFFMLSIYLLLNFWNLRGAISKLSSLGPRPGAKGGGGIAARVITHLQTAGSQQNIESQSEKHGFG